MLETNGNNTFPRRFQARSQIQITKKIGLSPSSPLSRGSEAFFALVLVMSLRSPNQSDSRSARSLIQITKKIYYFEFFLYFGDAITDTFLRYLLSGYLVINS